MRYTRTRQVEFLNNVSWINSCYFPQGIDVCPGENSFEDIINSGDAARSREKYVTQYNASD